MASVRDVAKEAGVSIGTVSRVINNHPQVSASARDRVVSAIKTSGYNVNRRGRLDTAAIALVSTGGTTTFNSPYTMAIFDGVVQGIQNHDYDLMVIDAQRARRSNELFGDTLRRKGVVGVLLRTTQSTRGLCTEICEQGVPGVVLSEHFDNPKVASIGASCEQACRSAIDHLLHLGHRRIAIALNNVDDHDHAVRFETYRASLQAAGVDPEERMVMRVPASRDAGAVALRQIMGMTHRPTAVFCTDPLAAVGLMQEALRMDVSIPRDLSVIGFDDTDSRFGVYPRMSSVCQDAAALGHEAFLLLESMIRDGANAPERHSVLQGWLEIHDSTAEPCPA